MKKRIPSFLSGFLTAVLLLALTTTALAASGKVSYNFANIALDGETKITAGSSITAPNGQQVPGSILYVDETGGKTNYLPIRAISDLLGVEISYDSATTTVYLGEQPVARAAETVSTRRWQREIDGKNLVYTCGEEGHSYDAPLTFRPTWEKDDWGIAEISHDMQNYTTTWKYQGTEGAFSLHCAYPSTAGFGRQMNSVDAIDNCQTLNIQGYAADYYQDGDHRLLVWENQDGILFFIRGTDVSRELLTEVAESVKSSTESVAEYSMEWLPRGYSLLDHYTIADTVNKVWVKDGMGLTWLGTANSVAVPDGVPETVTVNGTKAQYWAAEEPYEDDSSMTVNGEPVTENPVDIGGAIVTSGTIPGVNSKDVNTLVWNHSGVNFRLQGVLDKDTLIQIAENINAEAPANTENTSSPSGEQTSLVNGDFPLV